MLKPFYSHYTFLHISALKGSSSWSTDIFYEQSQQNPIKEQRDICNVAIVTYIEGLFNPTFTSLHYFVDPVPKMYQYSLRMAP
jgi:hypothetical protein